MQKIMIEFGRNFTKVALEVIRKTPSHRGSFAFKEAFGLNLTEILKVALESKPPKVVNISAETFLGPLDDVDA